MPKTSNFTIITHRILHKLSIKRPAQMPIQLPAKLPTQSPHIGPHKCFILIGWLIITPFPNAKFLLITLQ